MKKLILSVNPQIEIEKIVSFLKKTFKQQKINKVVVGLSGGIDSLVCYCLLKKVLPEKNIIAVHLPYNKPNPLIPNNIRVISIKKIVEVIVKKLTLDTRNWNLDNEAGNLKLEKNQASNFQPQNQVSSFQHQASKIRLGNIMSRVRMIILFDLAKKNNAMVCGTENKSEHLLGYFTRFGDSASDIEPIRHLYKTQVYQLAKYLQIPKKIINQKPTAGLWPRQTDEDELGFSYKEADQVLNKYFDKKMSTKKIIKLGFPNAEKIISFTKKNKFKQKTPYCI